MTELTRNQASKIIEMTQKNGGHSHWFDTQFTSGYSVGNGKAGSTFDLSHLHSLQWCLMGMAERFRLLGADGIGTWVDKGILYVDPIFHISGTAEAMMTGAMWGELAIYNLETNEVVSTQQLR